MKSGTGTTQPLQLERAIGLTTLSNASFANSPNGDIFYAAGNVVIKYNPEENKQKFFYRATKAVSCLAVSLDGNYLAIGERGHNSTIIIYDIAKGDVIVVLKDHHKYGVGCLSFSPNTRYLVSAGFKHDRQLIFWDWDISVKLSVQKLVKKVHAISYHGSGDYFVTAGDRHLKWWFVDEVLDGEGVALDGKPASILEEHRHSEFMDVVCGSGPCSSSTFCTTSAGVLCVFNEERMMEKCVPLESPTSYCLELFCANGTPGLLTVGCANGIVRCFSPLNLNHIATLPVPAPLSGLPVKYPACYGLRKVPGTRASPTPKLGSIYADHSLFVWDISDVYGVAKYRSFLFHHSCVWDVQFIETCSADSNDSANQQQSSVSTRLKASKLPVGTFVTCSTDNTVKFWNTDPKEQRASKFHSVFSREMLHSVDIVENAEDMSSKRNMHSSVAQNSINSTISSFVVGGGGVTEGGAALDLSTAIPDPELPDRPKGNDAPRCLAVHPYGHELAIGSKAGRLRILDLQTMGEKRSTPAHAAEILSLSYSPPLVSVDGGKTWSTSIDDENHPSSNSLDEPMVLLATAGRDRLIHVLNASMQYSPIDTLDHHSSSVSIVRFTSDGKRLISCGGDKNMVFSSVNGPEITKLKSVQTPNGNINGLAIEASNKFAVTSGQDKRLNIWNVQSGKHMRAYKSDSITSELYKSDIDPSGMYIATCAFDKSVSIFDFFSGELITQVTGHGEVVTGVRFSPDGQRLITIGGDGCIFIWRLGPSLVKAMQDRLVELLSQAQKRSNKADQRPATTGSAQASSLPNAPPPKTSGGDVFSAKPPAPPSQEPQRPSTGISKPNKWGAKPDAGGYEILGQKIEPSANRNQFTIDLSADESPEKMKFLQSPASAQRKMAKSPSRLANSAEEKDDVMRSALSDDEPDAAATREPDSDDDDESDGSHLFKPAEEDYDTDVDHDNAKTSDVNNVSDLEQSAQHVDGWLANVLRSELKLDECVSTSIAQEASESINPVVVEKNARGVTVGETSDHLNQSLSSAFFKNLRSTKSSESATTNVNHNLPPPPPVGGGTALSPVDEAAADLESKRRDRASAVARMKERMRLMGIEKAKKRLSASGNSSTQDSVGENEDYADDTEEPDDKPVDAVVPPQPPILPSFVQTSASGVSEDQMDETVVMTPSASRQKNGPLVSSEIIAQQLESKASNYRSILSELERAKQRAADSYQEILALRSSLEESMCLSPPTAAAAPSNKVDLSQSMAQTDQLLSLFRESFAQLSDTQSMRLNHMSFNQSHASFGGSSGTGSVLGQREDAAEVSQILEKYSDRLLELVSDKIAAKFNK